MFTSFFQENLNSKSVVIIKNGKMVVPWIKFK